MTAHFDTRVTQADPLIADALRHEKSRQQDQIELIASENIVSRAVLDALGHEMTNKTLEGYPGNRFHGGGKFVDIVEQAAIDRAKRLFGCDYANVQPHSGSQANLAVFFLLLKPGDRVLSLDLAAGGHLSHGLKANLSGRWFEPHHYGVDPETEVINYDALEQQAQAIRPQADHRRWLCLSPRDRFRAHGTDRKKGRRLVPRGYGPYRGIGGRRRASVPLPTCRHRHLHHDQNIARTAWGPDPDQ